jgi:hypothetical protein
MSKNFIEIEGNALNLSLSGASLNQSKNASNSKQINSSSKKPPSSYTNRSSLSARRSNSIVVRLNKNKFLKVNIFLKIQNTNHYHKINYKNLSKKH